jgi:hypothetical protein
VCVCKNAVKLCVLPSAVCNSSHLKSANDTRLTSTAIMKRFTVKQIERVQADNTVLLFV